MPNVSIVLWIAQSLLCVSWVILESVSGEGIVDVIGNKNACGNVYHW